MNMRFSVKHLLPLSGSKKLCFESIAALTYIQINIILLRFTNMTLTPSMSIESTSKFSLVSSGELQV